jgi:hypothetical protein
MDGIKMKNSVYSSPRPVVGDMILYKSELSNMPDKLFRVTAVHPKTYGNLECSGAPSVVGKLIKKYEADGWIDVTDSKIQQIYYWNGIVLN